MLADLLTDPDRFFRDVADDDALLGPTIVVLLLGLVTAVGGLPLARATAQMMPPEAGAFAGIVYASAVVGGFIYAFVVWVIYTAVFHLVSGIAFDGEGSFGRTAAVTAWGFVPAIVVGVVYAVLSYYALRTVAVPSGPSQLPAFVDRFQHSPYVLLGGILGVFFLLWQAFIWIFGVAHARGIELREAAITVAVPVGVAILWRVYNLA